MRPKTVIPFAEWAPDASVIASVAREAKGVVSSEGTYRPLSALVQVATGSQINDVCLGAKSFYGSDGAPVAFCGDTARLYRIVGKVPVQINSGLTASIDWAWSFEQFGNNILAVARGVNPMKFVLGASSAFADIPDAPGGDVVFRVKQHMFICDGSIVNCSAYNNVDDWDVSNGLITSAFANEVNQDAGRCVAGWGGEQGVIFQERGMIRLTYTGAAGAPFIFDEVEGGRGLCGPNAYSAWGKQAFCAAEDGFYIFDGLQATPIGQGKVDRYFSSNLNYGYRHRVWAEIDPGRKCFMVGFPTGTSTYANEILIYSWQDGRWTHDDFTAHLGFEMHKEPINADDEAGLIALYGTANADAAAYATVSVDSPAFLESRKQWAVFDSDRKLCQFTGTPRAATISTALFEPQPGNKAFVTEIIPVTDAAYTGVTAKLGTRLYRLDESETLSSASSMTSDGFCPVMGEGRYLRGELTIAAGTTWTEASGLQTDASVSGER